MEQWGLVVHVLLLSPGATSGGKKTQQIWAINSYYLNISVPLTTSFNTKQKISENLHKYKQIQNSTPAQFHYKIIVWSFAFIIWWLYNRNFMENMICLLNASLEKKWNQVKRCDHHWLLSLINWSGYKLFYYDVLSVVRLTLHTDYCLSYCWDR